MHNIDLLTTLTLGFAAALVLGYITNRIGLSPIVGYLLAGIAVGPFTPGFVADHGLAEQMAEVGVILLLFGVGLHFHFDDLLAVRGVAVPGAVVQSLTATGLGVLLAHSVGWSWSAGIVFGMAISVASTVVLTRVLIDNNDLHTPTGHVAIGWLVVEDLFTVLLLVLLPALFGGGAVGPAGLALALGFAVLKVAGLLAATFVVGGRVIPWLLERVAASRSRELFTLTVLVVALGIAVGSARIFGVSMELGAFGAGMVVGRSEFSLRAASDALPMRDAFAVLFFVSVGMLFDPGQVFQSPWLVAGTTAIVLLGKPLAAIVIVLALGYPVRVAFAVAAALAQIGEFSFILAAVGADLGVLGVEAENALIGAAIISITLNPLLYRLVGPTEKWIARSPGLSRLLNVRTHKADAAAATHDASTEGAHRARSIVVGYGPVGQTVTRLLIENNIEPVVVEMNLETTRKLRSQGIAAVYGDAGKRDTLEAAGIAMAGSLILSSANTHDSKETIRVAHELNRKIRVMARTTYLREISSLRAAGAEEVFAGELELALAFAETVLRTLGAAPEQIERERERVHRELIVPAVDGSAVK